MKPKFRTLYLLLFVCCSLQTCRVASVSVADPEAKISGFPKAIDAIMQTKCATPVCGCHSQSGKNVAAGLSLETWDDLFAGSRNGAVCIPYDPKRSALILFTNTYPHLGEAKKPTMPYDKPPLSQKEMNTLIKWIKRGAPNSEGKITLVGK
jgi:Planctomycete cytochrome C